MSNMRRGSPRFLGMTQTVSSQSPARARSKDILHVAVIWAIALFAMGAGGCRELRFKAPAGSGVARVVEYPNRKLVIEVSEGSGLDRVVDSSIFAGLKPGVAPPGAARTLGVAPSKYSNEARDSWRWNVRKDAIELSTRVGSSDANEWMLSAVPSGEGRRLDRFFRHSLALRLGLRKYRSVHVQSSTEAFIFLLDGGVVGRILWLEFGGRSQ